MKLNAKKTKYMVIDFTEKYQFNTRIYIDEKLIEEVSETKLLGAIIQNDLKWDKNTKATVKAAFERFSLLTKLIKFDVKRKDLLIIYYIFINWIYYSELDIANGLNFCFKSNANCGLP